MRPSAAILAVLATVTLTVGSVATARAAIPEPVLQEKWQRVISAHFDVLGNVGRPQLVEITHQLERLAETLETIQPSLAARGAEPWRVYAFDGDATFKHYGLRNVENLLGYCLTTPNEIRLVFNAQPAADPREPVTMYHEFTHAYLNGNFQRVPLWLSEGLAQYYSTFVPGEQSAEIGRPISPAAEWCRSHALLPLETLFAIAADSPQYRSGDDRVTFYAQSWALVSHLISTAGRDSNAFERYLARLWNGEEPTRAFESVYPRAQWPALAASLKRYVDKGEYSYTRYTFTRPFDRARVEVKPVAKAERLSDLGDLLLLHHEIDGASLDRAEEHFRAAAEAAPEQGHGLAGLGYALDLRGRTASAESLYNAAYTATPDDPITCLIAGRGTLSRYERAPEGARSKGTLVVARNRFACCLAAKPHQTEALIGYGRTYALHPDPPERSGMNALVRGFHSRPDRVDLLWDLLALTDRAGLTAQTDSLIAVMKVRLPERDLARWRDRRGTEDANALVQAGIKELNRENYESALASFRRAQSTSDPRLRAEAEKFTRKAEVRLQLSAASVHLMNRRAARGRAMLDSVVTAIEATPELKGELFQELEYARGMRADADFQIAADEGTAHARAGRVEAARTAFTRALEVARQDSQKEYARAQLDLLKLGGKSWK